MGWSAAFTPEQLGYKRRQGDYLLELHTMGIDLGKTVFHLVGLDRRGQVIVRKSSRERNCSVLPSTGPFV
jgi:hypothetical protein